MLRESMLLGCLAASAWAQTKFDNGLTVLFKDNGAIHIHTESTRAHSPLSTSGVVAISEGDVSHRMVLARDGSVLFAYDISLTPVPNQSGVYSVRVKPADRSRMGSRYFTFAPGDEVRIEAPRSPAFHGSYTVKADGTISIPVLGEVRAQGLQLGALAAEILKRVTDEGRVQVTVGKIGANYPTLAAERDFPAVRLGEAVHLDIMENPSTGEKLFDVIQPIEQPAAKVRPAPHEEISLEQPRISVGGVMLREFKNSWMIGTGVKLTLPRHGTVYLALKPAAGYAFQLIGQANGRRLAFYLGNDLVEIVSRSNVLKTAEAGTVWVFHDSGSNPAAGLAAEVGVLADLLPQR